MRSRRGNAWLTIVLGLFGLPQVAAAQHSAASGPVPHPCPVENSLRAVTIHAAKRGSGYINLCDGHALTASSESGSDARMGSIGRLSQAQPLVLASADFDEDGVPDLVSGFANGNEGAVSVHRGNVHALWPYGEAVRNGAPSAFLPDAGVFDLPEQPDFLGVGDFNADGHWDIVGARRGGHALYFLLGDGHGGFSSAQQVDLPGAVTAVVTGEINRADGLTDIVVGLTEDDGLKRSRALVFESPLGAMRAEPEAFDAPLAVTALALGRLDGGAMFDLAIAAGNQLIVVHGRDRMLTLGKSATGGVAPAKIQRQTLPFSVRALAVGSFAGLSNLAALGDDGAVHLLENTHAIANLARMAGSPVAVPVALSGSDNKMAPAIGSGIGVSSTRTQLMIRAAAKRRTMALNAASGKVAEWIVRSSVTLPQSANASRDKAISQQLVPARISASLTDDLLVLDSSGGQVHVLSNTAASDKVAHAATAESLGAETMTPIASLDVAGAPAAVLPMRLNQHPLQSLVMLAGGQPTPSVALAQPAVTIAVTNTQDDPKNTIAGSLRQAINFLNNASYPSAEITFDIPLSDPNCDQNTHVCTIRPLSINPPDTLNDFALPGIFSVVTIDGYTQPGSSPNTLPGGDNAVILIRLDGSLATTPGAYGLYVFEDPATIRGFNIAGWNNPDLVSQPGFAVGANAIDINAVSTFAEGNFIGTSVDGNMSTTGVDPNGVGIFVENGATIGSGVLANVVGGTTPQARNVVSGNLSVGVFDTFNAPLTQIQGNFIGTDHTGTQALGNFQDGVLAARFDVIGGTEAGAGNVIAANGRKSYVSFSNIDINAQNGTGLGISDLVQGNFIGTDVTGTHALGGGAGVLIAVNYQFATVGGTTPAARNVISGNSNGVNIFDYASQNIVEGNYIGVDATGSKALGTAQSFGIVSTVATTYPALQNTFGGAVAGAGNVISGNQKDGISIQGSYYTDASYPNYVGNVIQGNWIGTDATGANSIPNGANGVHLLSATVKGVGTLAPTNNFIGGSDVGAANIISNNGGHGVFIEAGAGNNTVANVIHNNNGAGVRITGGNQNRISRNSIYGNGALGIDLDTAGPNANSACQADATGANNLQNAPVLTAGIGSTFLSATATDPNGNTSEFSNTVNVSGRAFNALGAFNGLPNTIFTIEFFSSPSADSSGFGQGDTYLGSTTVTTAANCGSTISAPINTDNADMSVSLSASNLKLGPAFGAQTYSSTVTNNGAATAHNVVWTDELPASLKIRDSSRESCANPVTTTVGSCTVSDQTVTCNLGTMASGATAAISIPVETETAGSIANTANVTATETDPNPANNTATVTVDSVEPYPVVDYLDPSAIIKGSGDTTLMVYGLNFLPTTTLTFDGTPLSATFFDNQDCPSGLFTIYCAGLQVVVPAALLATSGDATIQVANGTTTSSDGVSGFVQDSCQFTVNPYPVSLSIGAGGSSETAYTFANAPSCSWQASSGVPWIAVLDSDLEAGNSRSGTSEVHFTVLPDIGASRTGIYTQAGNTFSYTQTGGTACTYTLGANSATFSSAAGSGTIGITASDPSCNYTATQYGDWISAPTPGSQIGSGSLNYSVSANTGGSRTGRIAISTVSGGGAIFTINQNEASACYFTLNSTSGKFSTSGGSGSFAVVASQPSCAWTAKIDQTGQSFATLTSGASGTGNGTVNFNLASNTGDARTASITVGNTSGSSQAYSANQVSANTCSFALSPNSINISSDGGTDTIPLSGSYDFCKWTAKSNNPDALLLQRTSDGNGNTIPFTVAQNTGPARALTATVGCQTYTVNQGAAASGNPVPAIAILQPSSTPVGTAGLAITVKGTNFVSGSTVLFNGLPRITTYASATQVTAAILAHDIDTVSTASIVVTNPVPGGGVSNAISFAITGQNPTPTVISLQPASAAVGSAAFTLTVNGTNFTSTSVASFAGTPRTTTLVSPTQLTIPVTAADLASPGTPAVVVTNPSPGGGPSNSVSFNVTSPAPTLTSLSPTSVAAGSSDVVLTVQGTGFINSTVVTFNGLAVATVYIDPFAVLAVVPASAVASPGSYSVTVTNPSPGGGTSNSLTFTVTGTGNPTPAITILQPASANAGGAAFTLTVNGTNFINSSTVKFNGSARTTTYISATRLTASILASDISKTGTASVTVTSPSPGGGTSNAATFTIGTATNPVPAINTLQPASTTAGSGAFTLTVNGTGFISGSVVNFAGSARTTTYISSTQITAAILASDIASVGAPAVTVTNPSPGGGTSNAVPFTISAANNPVPAIATLQPASTTAGSGAFTLTVNGTGFINGSVVNFAGKSRTTAFIGPTQLTAAILAGDVTSAGTYAVTVTNPAPGGGISNAVTLSVNNPVPSITALQPQSVTAGAAAFTLTVNGTGFNPASIVSFNGSSQPTTLIGGTQLTAAISAVEVANAGTVPVSVTNPGPGGGTATAVNFTINTAATPQASLSPATLAFPNTTVGATSAVQSITLSNAGGAALNIGGITIGGAAPTDFSQTDNCGSSLAAGSSCTISVSFTPASAAAFGATVSVTDNVSGSPQTITLSGTGIAAPSFTVSSSTAAQTIQPGGTAKYSMSVVAHNGVLSNPVTLIVSGIPAGATATFAPTSVIPGSSSATSQLTIQTATTSTKAAGIGRGWPLAISLPPLLGLFLAIGGKRRRHWFALAVLLVASLGAVSALSGCGGGFALPGAGAKTYTITVTGTSGSERQSTTVQLIVQ